MVLDRSDRVLLLRASDPAHPAKGEWWELPGGGIERGESSAQAAAREAHEETGLAGLDVGPCIWRHRARFDFGGFRFDQQEHIHVARWDGAGGGGGYHPAGLEPLEALAFHGMQWFGMADLHSMVAGGVRVIPPWLPAELPRYLAEGPPGQPFDLGELGDVFGPS